MKLRHDFEYIDSFFNNMYLDVLRRELILATGQRALEFQIYLGFKSAPKILASSLGRIVVNWYLRTEHGISISPRME
jgi:hypothetical protein